LIKIEDNRPRFLLVLEKILASCTSLQRPYLQRSTHECHLQVRVYLSSFLFFFLVLFSRILFFFLHFMKVFFQEAPFFSFLLHQKPILHEGKKSKRWKQKESHYLHINFSLSLSLIITCKYYYYGYLCKYKVTLKWREKKCLACIWCDYILVSTYVSTPDFGKKKLFI